MTTGDPQNRPVLDGKPDWYPLWLKRLFLSEMVVAVAYAISLPLSLTLSWTLLITGLILWLGVSVVENKIQAGRQAGLYLVQAPLFIPLLLLSLSLTISGAFNGEAQRGLIGTHSFTAALASFYSLKTVLPYFWAYSLFRRSRMCAVTSLVLLLPVSALAGIWGSIQQVFHFHPFTYPYEQGTGFLGHPMAFAGQMQLFSLLALGLFLSGAYKTFGSYCPHPFFKGIFALAQRTDVFFAIVAANLAGLFFAGERSAWLGGFAGIMALAALKSLRFALKSILALSVATGLSYLAVPLVRSRLDALFSGHDTSVTVRTKIWKECIQNYFTQSPLVGIGWLNFPHFNIPEAIVPGVSKDLNHAHSNYIHILTTTGIIGLASYIILLVWIFKTALTKFRQALSRGDDLSAGLGMGLFAAAVSLAVAGIFEFNFGTAQVRMAQWFLFGLL